MEFQTLLIIKTDACQHRASCVSFIECYNGGPLQVAFTVSVENYMLLGAE
jgi:hypothetical protein